MAIKMLVCVVGTNHPSFPEQDRLKYQVGEVVNVYPEGKGPHKGTLACKRGKVISVSGITFADALLYKESPQPELETDDPKFKRRVLRLDIDASVHKDAFMDGKENVTLEVTKQDIVDIRTQAVSFT